MKVNGINKPVVTILAAWLACGVLAAHAENKVEDKLQISKQELSEAIKNRISSLDVNQAEKFIIELDFSTFHGMYAYRELLQWALALPEDSEQRRDIMTIVRSGMEAVIRDSGMGVPLSGWNGKGQPVGLLFDLGLPRYGVNPDFSKPETLKWGAKRATKKGVQEAPLTNVSIEAIGQSLAAKSLFIVVDTTPEGKELGKVLLPSALQEFKTLTALLELGGGKSVANIPSQFRLNDGKWEVARENSNVYGRMSLLQGLAQLYTLLSNTAAGNDKIDGKNIADWRKEVRLVMEKVYDVSNKQFFDSQTGSYLGDYDSSKGVGDRLPADDAGYILEVLAGMVDMLPKGDKLRENALNNLLSQANYVAARLEGKDLAPQAFLVRKNLTSSGMFLQLADQLSIVNGLLAVGQATGKNSYEKPALTIFSAAHKQLWSAQAGIFRSAAGQKVSGFDGRLFGMNLATWRLLKKSSDVQDAGKNGANHIQAVLKKAGMLQAEGPAGGEPKQPEEFISNDLPKLVNDVIALEKNEKKEKIAAAVAALTDQDGDAVPGCRFGGGYFGGAPVLIGQTSIATPYDPPADAAAPAGSAVPAVTTVSPGTTVPTGTTVPRRTP